MVALPVSSETLAQEDTRTRIVETRDLDLSNDHGVARLDGRLRRAVAQVCGRPLAGSVKDARAAHECREEAWVAIEPQRTFVIARANGGAGAELAANAGGTSVRIARAN
jgi:UrcA family protein